MCTPSQDTLVLPKHRQTRWWNFNSNLRLLPVLCNIHMYIPGIKRKRKRSRRNKSNLHSQHHPNPPPLSTSRALCFRARSCSAPSAAINAVCIYVHVLTRAWSKLSIVEYTSLDRSRDIHVTFSAPPPPFFPSPLQDIVRIGYPVAVDQAEGLTTSILRGYI